MADGGVGAELLQVTRVTEGGVKLLHLREGGFQVDGSGNAGLDLEVNVAVHLLLTIVVHSDAALKVREVSLVVDGQDDITGLAEGSLEAELTFNVGLELEVHLGLVTLAVVFEHDLGDDAPLPRLVGQVELDILDLLPGGVDLEVSLKWTLGLEINLSADGLCAIGKLGFGLEESWLVVALEADINILNEGAGGLEFEGSLHCRGAVKVDLVVDDAPLVLQDGG